MPPIEPQAQPFRIPGVISINRRRQPSAPEPVEGPEAAPNRLSIRTSNYVHCGYTHPVKSEAESLLPLPPAAFHILVALADEDRHGYAVIKDVEARTGGSLKLSAGTLYRSVDRMAQQGLIREISSPLARNMGDERRRYYRITPFGREVAMAEARRLAQMLDLARAKGLAPRKV